MTDSPLFDWLCRELAGATAFSDIEARGTVRIALKKSGLSAATATPPQVQVVIKRMLPEELRRRGCDDGQPVCDGLALRLTQQNFAGRRRPQSRGSVRPPRLVDECPP